MESKIDKKPDDAVLDQLLTTAREAAQAGGDVLAGYFRDGVTIRNKSDQGGKSYDLVSDADIGSERAIVDVIHTRFPGHAILGEEEYQSADVDAEFLWVIDPLDGTNNYAHKIPHFAVSIGVYHHGRPVVGVVINPVRGDEFIAVVGRGATHAGSSARVSTCPSLGTAMIGCGFYYDRGEMMRATLAAIEACFEHDIHGIRRFGTASLDLCMVGCGLLDAFFEYNLSPWDFAAGALFVTEAGGRITTASGGPLPLTPTSVLVSNGRLHDAMLAITGRYHP